MQTSVRLARFVLHMSSVAALSAALGCSSALVSAPGASSAVKVTGNWQIASSASAAARLPMLSGELTGTSTAISGLMHARGSDSCVSSEQIIAVTGSMNSAHLVTLGGPLAGGTLKITGTLADDGKSLSEASYSVSGGSCAFPVAALTTAQAYSPITGNYTGTFADAGGPVLAIAASLNQTPASDTSGNFQLSGTATFPANGCFNSPVSVSNSQVTGGSFTLTYTDASTANSVTASGSFSPDGTTLTVTNWTLTGACGPDSGTGSLIRQ